MAGTRRAFVRLADRAVLRVAGEGSSKFLQGLCTQDVTSLNPAPGSCAAPAAFLSARGRVLCDTLLVANSSQEFLIDCHSAVAKSLLRLLIRHRLREPLTIDDVSSSHGVIASVPEAAHGGPNPATGSGADSLPEGVFEDPRFAALGQRGIVSVDIADTIASLGSDLMHAYHLWRMCCGVPEGPADFPVDAALPLLSNLDLLNFISFSKGCYVGQELTVRTKHRGAVRKRFFTMVATEDNNPQGFIDGLKLAPEQALPFASFTKTTAALPGIQIVGNRVGGDAASEEERTVHALRPGATDWKPCGVLHSAVGSIGLCLLRSDVNLNHPESFQGEQSVLPEGTKLATADGVPLGFRSPPYAFTE